jgi:hypothetical protein
MRGSVINLTATREGRGKIEGVIDDTSKPGTFMEVVPAPSSTPGGRQHYRARSQTAGAKGPLWLLDFDGDQGKTVTDAYVNGTRCFIIEVLRGDEVNCLLGDVVGTADKVTLGDSFGINNNGKLIANSSYTSVPFQALESLPALTADTLVYGIILE